MKRFKSLIAAFLIVATPLAPIALVAPIAITGCATNRVTYNTLLTVGTAVNSAYAAYNDQVVAGKATFNVSVASGYNKFQALYAAAVQAAQMNPNAIAPQDVIDLANQVLALIKQFTK